MGNSKIKVVDKPLHNNHLDFFFFGVFVLVLHVYILAYNKYSYSTSQEAVGLLPSPALPWKTVGGLRDCENADEEGERGGEHQWT